MKDKAKASPDAYVPTEREKLLLIETDRRRKQARLSARMTVKQVGDKSHVHPDHADHAVWGARLCAVLGTGNVDSANLMLNQIASATLRDDSRSADEAILNGIIATIAGIAPRDETEAMLALQMVATHNAGMQMLKRAMLTQPTDVADSIVNRATKLLRTYTAQVEALNRYRNAGKQQVVVQHQHVAVTADKAVVGINTPHGTRGGGTVELEEQPHAIAHAPMPPMSGANAGREPVPSPCDAERPL